MKKIFLSAMAVLMGLSAYALNPTMVAINLISANASDDVTLVEDASFSSAKEDYESNKIIMTESASNVNVYALQYGTGWDDPKAAIVMTDDLVGTKIVIVTNTTETSYKFTFSNVHGRTLKLWDKYLNVYTDITGDDGGNGIYEYSFTVASAGRQTIADRFEIAEIEYPFHPREVAIDNWGTICYPEQIVSVQGAVVYEIAGRSADATQIAVVPVAVADMVKGKPYLFNATADAQKFFYNPEVTDVLQAGANGLTGTFAQTTLGTDGYYVVKGQSFIPALGSSAVLANRAYLAVTDIATGMSEYTPQAGVSARFFSVGRGATTDEMRIENGEMRMDGKYLINGKFVIVKDGKTTNVLGFGL